MERNGQSALGIASTAIAAVSILAIFVVLTIAGAIEASTPGGMSEDSAEAVIIGMSIFGCIGLNLLAIGLGIGGIFQKAKERLWAVIGTTLATASIVITVFIISVGIAMNS